MRERCRKCGADQGTDAAWADCTRGVSRLHDFEALPYGPAVAESRGVRFELTDAGRAELHDARPLAAERARHELAALRRALNGAVVRAAVLAASLDAL